MGLSLKAFVYRLAKAKIYRGFSPFFRLGAALPTSMSTRRHAQRRVEPDDLAIKIRVVDHVQCEGCELVRMAEPARERDRGRKAILRLLWQAGQQRSHEQAGRDGQHANAELRHL